MSGYESPVPEDEAAPDTGSLLDENENPTPEAPDVAEYEGGDRPAGDVDDLQDPAGADEWATLEEGAGIQDPRTRENWRVT